MNDGIDAHAGALESVWLIIPALNEQESLPLVLKDLPPVGRVILVDNGSTDETARVAEQMGAYVVHEPQRGYGSACLRGLAEIRTLVEAGETRPSIVAFIDADYSDHPEQLSELVQPLLAHEVDFVLGSRLSGQRESGAMPPQSVFGNRFACFLIRILFGAAFTDLGPFRAIQYDRLLELGMVDDNFGWTIEMQIKAVRAGVRWKEIPVRYRRRIGQSKISGTIRGSIAAGTKILYTIAKYGLWKQGGREPARFGQSQKAAA